MANGLLIAGVGVAAATVAELYSTPLVDALIPPPPLPDLSKHNAAWAAAWTSVYGANVLGTHRRRAVSLAQLAGDQIDQLAARALSKSDELALCEAWLAAWTAADGADTNTVHLAATGDGSGALGTFANNALNDSIRIDVDNGDAPSVALSPLGQAWAALEKQRNHLAGCVFGSVTGECAGEVTRPATEIMIIALALALDNATEPPGFFGHLAEDATSIASGLGAVLEDALGSILGGAVKGIGSALLPVIVVGGGAFLLWRHYR